MTLYFECRMNKNASDCFFGDFVHWGGYRNLLLGYLLTEILKI